MKTLKFTGIISAILLMLSITSCKKDKYQPVGDYGNANVISSNTVTLNAWSTLSDDGVNFHFESNVLWGEITQEIVDNGAVMVYFKFIGSDWIALPFTISDDNYSSLNMNYYFSVGEVNIQATGFDDLIDYNASDFNGTTVRVVVITQEGRMSHPNVDLSNYEEVKRVFNLKD